MIPQELLKTTIIGERNGLPRFKGVYLGHKNGVLAAFVDRPYLPHEEKEEATDFPVQDLQTIAAVLGGHTEALKPEQQAALDAAKDEAVKAERQAKYKEFDGDALDALENWAKRNNIPEFQGWLAKKAVVKAALPKAVEVKKP